MKYTLIDLSGYRRTFFIRTLQVACVVSANVSLSILIKNL